VVFGAAPQLAASSAVGQPVERLGVTGARAL
jgi:hypothetical protein